MNVQQAIINRVNYDKQRESIIESMRAAYKACRAAGISKADLPTREHVEVSTNDQLIAIFQTMLEMIRIVEEVKEERAAALAELRDAYKAARAVGIAKSELPTRDDVINATIYELDILIQNVRTQVADALCAAAEAEEKAAEQAARAERGDIVQKLLSAVKNAIKSGVERSALPTFEQIKQSSLAELRSIVITVNQMALFKLETSIYG